MNMNTKENAVLFQRVSSQKQYDEAKLTRTREDAIEYANGGFTNFEGIEYDLDPTEYKTVGSAFKNDVRQSPEMLAILGKLERGEYKRPLHIFLASLDRLDRRQVLEAASSLNDLLKKGIIIHDISQGFVVGERDGSGRVGDSEVYRLIGALQTANIESVKKSNRTKRHIKQRNEKLRSGELKYIPGATLTKWYSHFDEEEEVFVF
ncbi:MAG TPA: hypothetical protein DCX67_05175, partial [Opitutae bacterium]|nr:hypothetical protein [Opitutae bacterium]